MVSFLVESADRVLCENQNVNSRNHSAKNKFCLNQNNHFTVNKSNDQTLISYQQHYHWLNEKKYATQAMKKLP